MRKVLLSLTSLCCVMLLVFSANAQLVSSGFESWTAGKRDGWFGTKTNIAASAVTQYSTSVHGGASAVKLLNQTTTHKRFTTQPVPIVTGTVYTVSFWVRGHGNIRVGMFDNRTTGTSAGYATYSAYTAVNSTAWTQVSYNDTAAATYASAEFILSVQSTLADLDDIQVDDVTVSGGSSNPGITIISPAASATVYDDFVNVRFTATNFSIPSDGHIQYNVDGGAYMQHLVTTPISVTGLTAGSHTVALLLVDINNNPINPVAASSVTFNVDLTGGIVAANVSALRAGIADNATIYRFTGQAVITQMETSVFQKFIQDGTGGVLIYDPTNTLPTTFQPGDAITNVVGKLQVYNTMLEFIPVNTGLLVSSGNDVTPVSITLNDLNANFEAYEAQLVKITGITFGATGNFLAGKAYKITNSVDSFRCSFYNADYVNWQSPLPTTTVDLIGILNARATGNYITSRYLDDIQGYVGVTENKVSNEVAVFPNPANNKITISNLTGVSKIEISNLLGQTLNVMNSISQKDVSMNLNNLKRGIYFISLYDNNCLVKTIKFTKE